jgi:hypothetical protein
LVVSRSTVSHRRPVEQVPSQRDLEERRGGAGGIADPVDVLVRQITRQVTAADHSAEEGEVIGEAVEDHDVAVREVREHPTPVPSSHPRVRGSIRPKPICGGEDARHGAVESGPGARDGDGNARKADEGGDQRYRRGHARCFREHRGGENGKCEEDRNAVPRLDVADGRLVHGDDYSRDQAREGDPGIRDPLLQHRAPSHDDRECAHEEQEIRAGRQGRAIGESLPEHPL